MRGARVILASTAFVACTSFGDAPDDSSPVDAGGGADASAESAPPTPDAGPRFCTTVTPEPTACLDFDDGVLTPPPWSKFEADGGTATLAASCGTGASTNCVELAGVRVPNAPSGAYGAALRYPTSGLPRSASVSAAVRLGEITGGRTDLLGMQMSDVSSNVFWVLELEVDGGGTAQLTEYEFSSGGNSESSAPLSKKLPVASWARVELVLDVGLGTSQARVRIDGADVGAKPLKAHTFTKFGHVEIGDRQLDVGVATRVRFDDIVVRISP